jgi:hypothetical protein
MHMAALTASDTFIEERKPEMTHALDMAIMKLNEQLGLSASALNEGLFVDASSEPEAVLEQVGVGDYLLLRGLVRAMVGSVCVYALVQHFLRAEPGVTPSYVWARLRV